MKFKTIDLTNISMFASLTAAGAFISIPVGPVPITLQSMFVMMSGIFLGAKRGFVSQLLYMIIGLIGIPVFAGGVGGIAAIMKPSFGFIFGFMAMAFVSGYLYEKGLSTWISAITGTIVLYMVGIPYMAFILNIIGSNNFSLIQILNMGLFMFIPGDLIKIIAVAWSISVVRKYINLPLRSIN